MTALPRWGRRCILCMVVLLGACASQRPLTTAPSSSPSFWQGKLAIKVFSKPVRAFSANFELQGSPLAGEMVLSTPLGTTLAHMQWDANTATLRAEGSVRQFASIQDLALQVTGANLPVNSLFAWLQGIDEAAPGWQADLQDAAEGRISARHIEEVQAELKIVFEK